MRGKRFFEERIRSLGFYHELSLDAKMGMELAAQRLRQALSREASECCRNALRFEVEESKVEYRGLIHYPIWSLSYEYRGEVYEGYVDGADGKVIIVEHPSSFEARALQVTTALAIVSASLAMGITFSIFTPFAILGALIPGVASVAFLLARGVTRRVKASEIKEIEDRTESIAVEKAFKALAGLGGPVKPIPDVGKPWDEG